jgi:hypothetical protein
MMTKSGFSGPRTTLGALLLALTAMTALVMPAQAAPTQKVYSVVISPGSVGAGQNREYTFTVANQAGSQSLGSVNLTTPPNFTFLAVTQQPSAGSAAIVGTTLQLRGMNLPASDSVSVKFTAEAPCVQSPGANQWGLAAKQSNDFKGTRNDFTLNAATSQRITNVTSSCGLNWITQPASAKVGQTITDADYDDVDGVLDGASIAAEVLSAPYDASNPTRVTFSSDQVGLAIGHDPNQPDETALLTGTTSATAQMGVATFEPGPHIDLHGLDYTLVVTNPNMTSDESAEFDISDAVGECAKGQCSNLKTDGDNINASLSSDSETGIIAMSIGVLEELVCPGYTPNPAQQALTILPLGVDSTSTMTVEITVLAEIVDRPASQYLICWASTKEFTERDGTEAEPATISGDPFFQGLLPDCARRDPTAPCQITPSKQDKQGNVILKVLAPGDDPHAR